MSGAVVVPRWCHGGAAVVLRWCCGGAAVVPQRCRGGAAVVPAVVPPWCCRGNAARNSAAVSRVMPYHDVPIVATKYAAARYYETT
jgi:hypothetical protein